MSLRTYTRTHYSEAEAARELGITVEQLRNLISQHILDRGEGLDKSRRARYQPSDLLVLKLLAGGLTASTNAG